MTKRILLVDDDPIWAEVAARALRAAGHHVSSASDHRKALEILEGSEPLDLLLTDIVMPQRVNGVALARMAGLRRPGLKVIYVTAYDLPGITLEVGTKVLRKPIDVELLVSEIAQVLGS